MVTWKDTFIRPKRSARLGDARLLWEGTRAAGSNFCLFGQSRGIRRIHLAVMQKGVATSQTAWGDDGTGDVDEVGLGHMNTPSIMRGYHHV